MQDIQFQREKTDTIIQTKFVAHCMNDTKWIKLLDALASYEGLVKQCDVKLVWDDTIRSMCIDGMTYDFDYYKHSMEGMISGPPAGFYDYKEIEWVQFADRAEELININNRKAGTQFVEQDVTKISEVIQVLGKFETEWLNTSFRVYGYK